LKIKMRIMWIMSCLLTVSNTHSQAKSFEILNHKVKQGDVIFVKIAIQWQGPQVAIALFDNHYLPNKYGEVYIGVSESITPGMYRAILVEYGQGRRIGWGYEEVEILGKNFSTRTRIPGKPRNSSEINLIQGAYQSGNTLEKHFHSNFVLPLDSLVIDKRRSVGDIISSFSGNKGHRGVDLITLNPRTGRHYRPVKAINSGKVVLTARNFSLEGNLIIIDHGSGVFSNYAHLSRFDVKQGDCVKTGQIIGVSGASGRITGPHLHLGIRIGDPFDSSKFMVVDPLNFIESYNKYRSELE